MNSPENKDLAQIRIGVQKSLPELAEIADENLRNLVVEAWAVALSETEFKSLEDVPPTRVPGAAPMKVGTQTEHIRGVARMAIALADELESITGPLGIDRDILLAAAICHDVGKPFEYSSANQARWRARPEAAGYPAIRHPVYGVHIALSVGLPEAVVHAAGAHSAEGENVVRSLENTIVHHADRAFWEIVEHAGFLESRSE